MADVMGMRRIEEKAACLGMDICEADFVSICLPEGEDFGITSDDEDVFQHGNFELDTGFGNIIVVDNLPVVPQEKFEKLVGVIRKHFSLCGVVKDDGLWMPVDPETQKTLGYCFIEYNSPQEAELAKETFHGKNLDRKHIFHVCTFDDFDRMLKVSDDWAPPEPKPYTARENLQKWLTDEKARDQFVIHAGSETEVFWNDVRQLKPDPVYKHQYWTDSFVQWSPLGTYLATVHTQGVAIWGGASTFNRLMRYAHPQVRLIDFSPGENYLVTCSCHETSNPLDANKVVVNIFDVRTGKVMREFKGTTNDFPIGLEGLPHWPAFKWGGGKDDRYFSRMGKNLISVYETETFSLIDRKPIKVENVVDLSWSPTDPILALFVPESSGGNQPARVSLVQIPGKEELRQKNLFSVSGCKMHWQSNGDYLAVQVDHHRRTKRSTYTGFEIFRLKERDIPIEVLELDNKNDKIIAFAWEPKGHRFAVIHGEVPVPDISFYSMRGANSTGPVSKLTTLKGKNANALFWSPAGRFIILAGLKTLKGQMEFYDVDDLVTMGFGEHFACTDIEWDPSGRYIASSVTSDGKLENGFNIWSFNGNLLYQTLKDHVFQFLWRPRPPSFLNPEKEGDIAKNLKKYSKKYEAEDQDVSMLLSKQERERRRMLKEEWEKWVGEWRRLHEEERSAWQELQGGETSDEEEDYEAKEVEAEEMVGIEEEILSF